MRSGESTQKREVQVGVTNIDFVQILNGVHEGEEIMLVEPDRWERRSRKAAWR